MKKRKRVYTNPTGRLWSPVNSLCTEPWPQADIVWRASRCVQVSPCARELDHAKLVRHGVKRALATDVLLRNEPGWYELYSSEGVDLRMIGYILNEVWSFAPAFVLCFRACVRACLRKKRVVYYMQDLHVQRISWRLFDVLLDPRSTCWTMLPNGSSHWNQIAAS
jgi:hypothetical protein